MTTIKCPKCEHPIEISEALQGQIEAQVLASEHQKHQVELEQVRREATEQAKADAQSAEDLARKMLASEREVMRKEADAEIEIAKMRLESEAKTDQRRAAAEHEALITQLREDSAVANTESKKNREQLMEVMAQLRVERQAKESAQLEADKKLAAEESKIRESAAREAEDRQRLTIATRDKTISDLTNALQDAQRKAAQGSQQLQGEILELDLETALSESFRDDVIEPVAKGVKGGDVTHTVRTGRGTDCGKIIWEFKRTKNWTDSWIPKLKQDMRDAKAHMAVIVSEVLPKDLREDIGYVEGVWVCKPQLAIVLGTLLRKGLLDVNRQKSLDANRTTSADGLYNFVTSHEFVQPVEAMIETYNDMLAQVMRERVAYEKLWAQREAHAKRLLVNTAAIIGSMGEHIGMASMPKIKGLELLVSGLEAGEAELL